jgi:formate hydrogenlyase subunit 3/multisubunit Na+/H+ antiporter MnhD subunit
VFGLAYLGFVMAVAIRFGAIPFHFWAARLADAAPEVTLPMLMAWSPAAFTVVALAWTDQSVAPLLLPLSVERALIVAVGSVSVVLGTVAALVQDDLEHVVGYTIIADAGVAILGLAALNPAVWEPARTWVLVFVMVRSAFAAWAVAMRGTFGTRRIAELGGWVFRAPLLALAFALIVVAAVGWPGFVAWQARATLIDLTLDGPFLVVVTAGALAQIAVYGRLLIVGLGPRSTAVAGGAGARPHWPAAVPRRPMVGQSGAERGFERMSHSLSATLDVAWVVPAALQANRVLIAGLLVLALSGLAFGVASGGFGVPAAAAAVPGQVTGPTGSEPPGAESAPPQESVPPQESPSQASETPPSQLPSSSEPAPASSPPAGDPSFQPAQP